MTSAVLSRAQACASNQSIFLAGESGPVWRVVAGVVRLDRDHGPIRQPVQLALPGFLGLPGILSTSDLVATLPRHIGESQS